MYSSLNAGARSSRLDVELGSVNIEPSAKSWLIQNVDPFHDNQFTVSAPPTPSMLDSAVQCRRIRAQIQADSTGVISIFVPPCPTFAQLLRGVFDGNDVSSTGVYGGVMYRHGTTEPYQVLVSLGDIFDGPWRVCGFGWELINTTPNMYKSGSLLVYQCPQQLSLGGQVVWGSFEYPITGGPIRSGVSAPSQTYRVLPVPLTPEEATSLPSSKQWDSKHGLYCVPRLTTFDAEFQYDGKATWYEGQQISASREPTASHIAIAQAGLPAVIPYRGERFFTNTPVADYTQPKRQPLICATHFMPYTATGVHITGLSPESTFTLVATYYVQILPSTGSSLLSLV